MINLKIFLDTANVDQIKEIAGWGILDGVTTNPTLIAKEGRDFREVVTQICSIVDGPISAEAVSMTAVGIMEEARELTKIHPNVNIKIPIMPEGLKAIAMCKKEGIKTNATLIFSSNQALLAAKAGASFVSPFIGRLDNNGQVGMEVIESTVTMFENYNLDTEIIVASVRSPLHVIDSAMIGAHICTIPYAIIKKMVTHPLTDVGIKSFLADWEKVPK